MKKLLILLALVAMLTISFAATAQAGKVLSFKRAAAVSEGVARADCNADPDCQAYGVRQCRRQAIRKIRCSSRTEGVDALGPYACERPVLVRLIASNGSIKYATGEQVCGR